MLPELNVGGYAGATGNTIQNHQAGWQLFTYMGNIQCKWETD
jgi:hypothetical protein